MLDLLVFKAFRYYYYVLGALSFVLSNGRGQTFISFLIIRNKKYFMADELNLGL